MKDIASIYKELDILINHWGCRECQQRFTHHDNYDRHLARNRCMGGQPKLVCLGKKFKHIMNATEKVFFGRNTQFSWKACRWIEHQSKLIGQHIHHALRSHRGESCVVINKQEILVDGFDYKSSTVYQFYGCKWHGCPCNTIDREECKYYRTMDIKNQIQGLGHNVVSVGECSHPELPTCQLNEEFIPYPQYIIYNFKAVLAKKDLSMNFNLTINSFHILISVAINDSITQELIFLHN